MRLDHANVVIRPRSPSSVADLAIRYVLDLAPRVQVRLGLLFLLPGWALMLALRHFLELEWGWVWLWSALYVTFAQGVFSVAAGQLLFDRKITVRRVLATYKPRFFAHFWNTLWTRVLVVVGMPIFGLGLYWWGRYSFIHEATLLEGMTGPAGARRSAALSKNSSSDVVALLFLIGCFHAGAAFAVEVLCRGVLEWLLMMPQLAEPLEDAGGSPFALFGFFLATPFAAALRFLMYIDGRTKHDGWDVQVQFMRIEADNQEAT